MPIRFVEQVAGIGLLTLILIFVTVLYARAGSGLIAPHGASVLADDPADFHGKYPKTRASVGAALVIHPALGSGVRATGGDTPTTFTTALLAGGSGVSIVGAGGFEPHTDTFRLFYFLTALAGTAVTSLVLTYLMQVYTALLRRNTVALEIDTWSCQTGDAVELLARLFPEGQTSAATTSWFSGRRP